MPSRRTPLTTLGCGALAALAFLLLPPGAAGDFPDDSCVSPDDGTGTATLPPPECPFVAPDETYMIIDGLPPGTTIELEPLHRPFVCAPGNAQAPCETEPGGNLGGERMVSTTTVVFSIVGTGDLSGFHRILALPIDVEIHSAPRTPGDPVQQVDTDLFLMQGVLFGDPDFNFFQIIGGTDFGLPSPGQTTLDRLGPPGSDFQVDSFFDVTYQIQFQGAPGGAIEGLSGSTQGTVRIEAAGERDPCTEPDAGGGSVDHPVAGPGCDVFSPELGSGASPEAGFRIVNGLPPGTVLELDPRLTDLVCTGTGGACSEAGGGLGGEQQTVSGDLVLQVEGTGDLDGFLRTVLVPVAMTTETGPQTAGQQVQGFPTELVALDGSLFGDPDFDSLMISAGSGSSLPSPGHTTLTDLGEGTFQVDSFFDVAYEIQFVGAPGGALDGLAGTTTGSTRLVTRRGEDVATAEDDGTGNATLPPEGSDFGSPDGTYHIVDGLPPGAEIEVVASHHLFFCQTSPCSLPGGGLGGTTESFDLTLELDLLGTGSLAGFARTLQMPATAVTDTGPRTVGTPIATDWFSLDGVLPPGDPDFDQLTLQAGSDFGLPSPGSTTLTDLGGGEFRVDSFFDIEYRIDFVGAPGGALDGLSGSTVGELRITARDRPEEPDHAIRIQVESDPPDGTDFAFSGLGSFSLDVDADPALPQWRGFFLVEPGLRAVTETVPPGWVLYRISCDDPGLGAVAILDAATLVLDLDLGESFSCTFWNAAEADFVFADGFESGDLAAWSSSAP